MSIALDDLQYVKTKTVKPPKVEPVGEVGVQLPNGETHSDLFNVFDSHTYDWGVVGLGGDDVGGIAQRNWSYQTSFLGGAPLAASGTLTLSLTRFKTEATQPLTSSTVPVEAVMRLTSGGPVLVSAATTLPAVQNMKSGTVTVAADLAALRAVMRAKLEAGQYQVLLGNLPTLTPEVIDALVNSMFGVQVRAEYTIKN